MKLSSLLTSGYSFQADEYETKLKYILFNLMLLFNVIMVGVMFFVRLGHEEYTQAFIDAVYVFFGIFTFILARHIKKYFEQLMIFVIIYSYLITSASFYMTKNPLLGIAWFMALIIVSFFIKGTKTGALVFIISQITILFISILKWDYAFGTIFVSMIPFYSIFFFMLFFEKRNDEYKKRVEKQKNDFKHQAEYDDLTQVPNRSLFNDRLQQCLNQAQRNNANIAVCFIDIDKFKYINDTFGHEVGDIVLKEVTERLHSQIRDSDTFARLGGDEFAVIIHDFHQKEDVIMIVEKFFAHMQEKFFVKKVSLHVTLSIGVVFAPKDFHDIDILMSYADKAMYTAKASGRNQYHIGDIKS